MRITKQISQIKSSNRIKNRTSRTTRTHSDNKTTSSKGSRSSEEITRYRNSRELAIMAMQRWWQKEVQTWVRLSVLMRKAVEDASWQTACKIKDSSDSKINNRDNSRCSRRCRCKATDRRRIFNNNHRIQIGKPLHCAANSYSSRNLCVKVAGSNDHLRRLCSRLSYQRRIIARQDSRRDRRKGSSRWSCSPWFSTSLCCNQCRLQHRGVSQVTLLNSKWDNNNSSLSSTLRCHCNSSSKSQCHQWSNKRCSRSLREPSSSASSKCETSMRTQSQSPTWR